MSEDIWHPPEVHAAWESGRRQGHLDKAGEISAAIAERDALRAEVERLREALDDAVSALVRVRQVAVQADDSPLSMGEIVHRVDMVVLGDSKP